MSDTIQRLFQLGLPWWEFVLRAVAVYVVVLVLLRITTKRTLGQATPFDLVVIVFLGSAVQNSLIGDDISLSGGLILAATLILLNTVLGRWTAHSTQVDRRVEGHPVVLASHGVIHHERLREASLSIGEFSSARRQAGIVRLSDIRLAVLEPSGKISFIRRDRGRG